MYVQQFLLDIKDLTAKIISLNENQTKHRKSNSFLFEIKDRTRVNFMYELQFLLDIKDLTAKLTHCISAVQTMLSNDSDSDGWFPVFLTCLVSRNSNKEKGKCFNSQFRTAHTIGKAKNNFFPSKNRFYMRNDGRERN
jgi:hypothetical protein